MDANKIFFPATAGTSLMTFFSYVVSQVEGKNFSEPELLAALEKRILPEAAKRFALPAGWLTHYSVGILITWIYEFVDRKNNDNPSLSSGILLGGLSGIAGIAIWKTVFTIHPAPPSVPERKFFMQLLLAHFVFGITVAATRRLLGKKEKQLIV